jgi:hypothetical protein
MDEKARVAGIQGVRKWWNIYLLCTLGHTLFMSSLARPRSINRLQQQQQPVGGCVDTEGEACLQ